MANQNQNRGIQSQPQGQTRQMQNRSGEMNQGQTYYSYSYGYGYYDPYTGDWIEEYYGPFTGVGPQDYHRSDDRIEEDVCDRLTQHGQLDARDIEVNVNGGEVTLKGNVPDRRMKRLAEDLALNVPGVLDVQNQLRIDRQLGQPGQGQPGQFTRTQNFKTQLRQGMDVLGSDGKKIGAVKEIHEYDFLIDRTLASDVHVPFSSIESVTGSQVYLNIASDQVDKMHWSTTEKSKVGTH